MNRAPKSMSALKAGERDVFETTFAFLPGETFNGVPTVSLAPLYGADADASLALVSTPQTSGSTASMILEGRVAGVIYTCRVLAETSLGRILAEDFIFEVRA
jgi:hypothetical protein